MARYPARGDCLTANEYLIHGGMVHQWTDTPRNPRFAGKVREDVHKTLISRRN
jgi:hypothetical protein